MANNSQLEAYEKLMSANHGRMIDLVKFAETKNAALLTFCSVWMGGIITLLRAPEELPFGYKYAFMAALPFLVVAAVISLRSLLPRLLEHVYKREKEDISLLYFRDIARTGARDYPERAKAVYLSESEQSVSSTYLRHLSEQTAIQASIADRKFRLFHWAGSLVFLAFVCMALPPAIFFFRWSIEQLHC